MHRHVSSGSRLSMAVLLAALGCQSYRPAPIDPEQVLEEVAARREAGAQQQVLGLGAATALMRAHNPRVLEARAAHATARALADTPTPLPNPVLGAGPVLLDGADILGSARHGVEAGLGWSVPLAGRRRLTDDLHLMRAEAAFVECAGVEREEYLALRRAYAAMAAAERRLEAREELARAVDVSVETTRRLIEAARATALDLRQLELERARAEADTLEAREELVEARGELAGLVGIPARAFSCGVTPVIDAAIPDEEELRALLVRDHPRLAAQRADYLVAEKELRLEVAAQFPDLELGFGFEREEEVNRYGLVFGIEIPLFDRNQQGIAEARARREELRVRYEAQVARGLAEIETARERLLARRQRMELLRDRIHPASEEALALARRALEAGASDVLQLLDLLRADRQVHVELIEAEQALAEAWSDLEEACGTPLMEFPEEAERMA